MEEAYLLLGGNLGEREQYLETATRRIKEHCGAVIRMSSIYESEPWGFEDNRDFLNQVIVIRTKLDPHRLLGEVLKIEDSMGRKRIPGKFVSRKIDIDILFYGKHIVEDAKLKIPHPRLQERRFVLMPLLEIAPELKHPVLKKTMRELYSECPDKLRVSSYFDRSLLPKY